MIIWILLICVGGYIISTLAKSGINQEEEQAEQEAANDFQDALEVAASKAYYEAYPIGCSSPYEIVALIFYFNGHEYTGYFKACSHPLKIE